MSLAIHFITKLAHKFTRIERGIALLLVLAIVTGSVQLAGARRNPANLAPEVGGIHIEGLIGAPRFVNPVLSGTNSVDRDLARLIYSGLVKITPTREVVADLATGWSVVDQGKGYIFNLRNDVTWHDGTVFSADDVVYTINVIQNNDYTGILKNNFAGITVEKLDDFTVKFTLPNPSSFFLYELALGIIPEHIFRETPVRDFSSFYRPGTIVGTGAYAYAGGSTAESITLRRYDEYYGTRPYLERLVFYFYDSEKTLLTAFRNRTVNAAGFSSITNTELASIRDPYYKYRLPQYRAVFFNQLSDNAAIKDKAVRQALSFAVDTPELITALEDGNAEIVHSPILPGFWGHNPDLQQYNFDLARAAKVLTDAGWRDIDGDGFLEKDNVRLSFTLATRNDAKLSALADLLAKNWRMLGAEVVVDKIDTDGFIRDVVRTRGYQVLLFGQDLGGNSDPYVYWHSSQIADPGLNLAPQVDKDIDNNLESARLAPDLNRAIGFYLRFQQVFADLVPAILLYQPNYTYIVDDKVKGVTDQINLSTPADRFANIDQWYIRTRQADELPPAPEVDPTTGEIPS